MAPACRSHSCRQHPHPPAQLSPLRRVSDWTKPLVVLKPPSATQTSVTSVVTSAWAGYHLQGSHASKSRKPRSTIPIFLHREEGHFMPLWPEKSCELSRTLAPRLRSNMAQARATHHASGISGSSHRFIEASRVKVLVGYQSCSCSSRFHNRIPKGKEGRRGKAFSNGQRHFGCECLATYHLQVQAQQARKKQYLYIYISLSLSPAPSIHVPVVGRRGNIQRSTFS